MGYINSESAKEKARIRIFDKKKLSLFKEVVIFSSIIISKNRFYWYCEILQFSGIFGLESVVWAIWTVNVQKIWSEYVYLRKSSHYLKKLQIPL